MKTFFFTIALLFATLLGVQELEAAPKFKKTKLVIDKITMKVEVADTDDRREYGLMNRSNLKDSEGMIFLFDKPEPLSFWMKNTIIPLSIAYIDADKTIFQILDMDPASPMDENPPSYHSVKPAQYALEEPVGWFKRKHIDVGAKISLPDLKK